MIIKFLNNNKVEQECKPIFSSFPDGQPHVVVNPVTWIGFDSVEIHCSIRNPIESFQLSLVWNILLDNYNPNRGTYIPCLIDIYWLFGARMDRRIDNLQPDTFKVVRHSLPPTCPKSNIRLLDIHNPRAFPEAGSINLFPIVNFVLEDFGDCDIYFPDKGARDRYVSLLPDKNCLYGKKKRDSQTGKLSGFELDEGVKSKDSILIIDDLCDGGGTFIGQYGILKELGYKKIGLYTTHGLYTKGMEVLRDFDEIYSTNSFQFGIPTGNKFKNENRLVLRKYQWPDHDFGFIEKEGWKTLQKLN